MEKEKALMLAERLQQVEKKRGNIAMQLIAEYGLLGAVIPGRAIPFGIF